MDIIGFEIYSVDAKGRINLPSKVRKQLSDKAEDTFVATRSQFDKCIYVYPRDEWEKEQKEFAKLQSTFNREAHELLFRLRKYKEYCEIGAQSRISISERLLRFAGITNEVLIIGAGNKIELWNPKEYENAYTENEERLKELVEKVSMQLGMVKA
ncbi:MAG: division/cell wall cluster transcriptional repressor MraZ [Bacteroidota bacterium]